jgi:thioredoxin-like negative regulator of GroEL
VIEISGSPACSESLNNEELSREFDLRPRRLSESIVMTTRFSLTSICLLYVSLFLPAAAKAQEVEWRTDYGKALQEAGKKNRPLVIDVGTENCFYCKQLDQRTFKDASLVSMLNERCIPLRIDADQHPRLTEALRVQLYPTLVFATADGKILGYQQGFIEAGPLQERLNTLFFTPAAVAGGSGATTPNRDIDEAKRAIAASDYPRALAILKPIAESSKDTSVQEKAKQLIQDMEQQAAGRCAEARQLMEKGKVPQAAETVAEVVRVYPGTQAAREGGKLLVSLASRITANEDSKSLVAREMLDQAREDFRRKQFLSCLDRCESLMVTYANQNEGAEASKLAAEIRDNPESAKQVCEQLSERLGGMYLSLAESLLKKGQPQQAIFYLERVKRTFPGTRNAEVARVRLAQIQGPNIAPETKK